MNYLINDQAASVQETSAAVEQLISNVKNIENSTRSEQNLISLLLDKAKAGEDRMKENFSAIDEIKQSSEFILSLIAVIDGIFRSSR